ncbi:mCG1045346 [Mus musculus]|nr:mCG1045346 [Mus musculus]
MVFREIPSTVFIVLKGIIQQYVIDCYGCSHQVALHCISCQHRTGPNKKLSKANCKNSDVGLFEDQNYSIL